MGSTPSVFVLLLKVDTRPTSSTTAHSAQPKLAITSPNKAKIQVLGCF
jgi:hypothetical protein